MGLSLRAVMYCAVWCCAVLCHTVPLGAARCRCFVFFVLCGIVLHCIVLRFHRDHLPPCNLYFHWIGYDGRNILLFTVRACFCYICSVYIVSVLAQPQEKPV